MAKSKYTTECVEQIVSVIAQTGSDRAGYEAGKISKDTFYTWIKRYPDFSDQINQAKAEYRDTCPEVLIRQAKKSFADYLFGRVEITTTSFERAETEKGSYSKETTKRVRFGTPRWAIERVLGGPIDELEALKVLVNGGILPHWIIQVAKDEMGSARAVIRDAFTGVLPEREHERVRPGLSEETAAAIRAQILGVESTDSVALPSSLGDGLESNQDYREVTAHRH